MTKTKLNYEFSIRDIEQTRLNHYKRILKMRNDKSTLVSIVTRLEQNNEYETYQTFDSGYTYASNLMNEFRTNKTQKVLKSLKSYINAGTIQHIKFLLDLHYLPESYFTAFYCIFYTRINKLMKRNLKAIINY